MEPPSTETNRHLNRIANALERLVELSIPREVDIEKLMEDATSALKKTNPIFRAAHEAMEKREQEKLDADASR